MTEQDVINKYLGVSFLHRGRSIIEGFDCYGLILAIYADLGYKLLDIEGEYDLHWSRGNDLILDYHKQWVRVDRPQLFDGVLFKNKRGLANHGGVCLGGERFIQCSQRVGVIVKKWTEEPWSRIFEGFYHFKGMQ